MEITREENGARGRWVMRTPEGDEAELLYIRRDGALVAHHTETPPAFRGKGAAAALVERAVEDARASGERILPTCSYVAKKFHDHPEWRDVLAD